MDTAGKATGTGNDEASLIARILAGERELFHDLIRPYQRMAYVTALGVLKNESDAEDAAQEAIVKAYRGLATFRAESKFSTWLVTIVMNEARTRLRKAARMQTESLDTRPETEEDFTPAMVADWREIPSETLERTELATQIERAIASLPDAYREAFLLRDKDALSIQEIAALLGVQPNLVKVRLYRARMLLQKHLTSYLKLQVSKRRGPLSWLGGA
jgi:RNA polymerase sigma-70 factor (ECF subfamily)